MQLLSTDHKIQIIYRQKNGSIGFNSFKNIENIIKHYQNYQCTELLEIIIFYKHRFKDDKGFYITKTKSVFKKPLGRFFTAIEKRLNITTYYPKEKN